MDYLKELQNAFGMRKRPSDRSMIKNSSGYPYELDVFTKRRWEDLIASEGEMMAMALLDDVSLAYFIPGLIGYAIARWRRGVGPIEESLVVLLPVDRSLRDIAFFQQFSSEEKYVIAKFLRAVRERNIGYINGIEISDQAISWPEQERQ